MYKCTMYKVAPFLYLCTLQPFFIENSETSSTSGLYVLYYTGKTKHKLKQYLKAGGNHA